MNLDNISERIADSVLNLQRFTKENITHTVKAGISTQIHQMKRDIEKKFKGESEAADLNENHKYHKISTLEYEVKLLLGELRHHLPVDKYRKVKERVSANKHIYAQKLNDYKSFKSKL